MGRPLKNPDTLTRYMKKKLEANGEVPGESQPGIKHKITKDKNKAFANAARNEMATDPGDPFVKKMRIVYAAELESGVDGVTSKCHYHGLTELSRSHRDPHPEIKRLMSMQYPSLPQGDKDAIAAYGFQILMGLA
jgi:hypothetical protein